MRSMKQYPYYHIYLLKFFVLSLLVLFPSLEVIAADQPLKKQFVIGKTAEGKEPSQTFAELSGVIKIGAYINKPRFYYDEDNQMVGRYFRKLQCVFNNWGKEFEISLYPWGRAQLYVAEGKLDMHLGAKSSKRDKYAVMSTPFIKNEWALFSLKNSHRWNTYEEIRDHQELVTARMGTNKSQWLKEKKFLATGNPKDIEALLLMLMENRGYAILESSDVVEVYAKENNIPMNTFQKVVIKDKPVGAHFSKKLVEKHPGIVPMFNKNILNCTDYK